MKLLSLVSGRRAAARTFGRRLVSELVHLLLASLAWAAAFWLRWEFTWDAAIALTVLRALPVVICAKGAAFRLFALRDLAWRYVGLEELVRLSLATSTSSALGLAGVILFHIEGVPRSVVVLDLLLSTAALAAAHAMTRWLYSRRERRHGPRRNILIYGAGQAGRTLLGEIRSQPELHIVAVGFLDDNPRNRHLRFGGLKVLGDGNDLAHIARRKNVSEVWLALPQASAPQIAIILEKCQLAGITAKRIPPLAELIRDRILLEQIREVRLEDLLGRAPVTLTEDEIRRALCGKTVLVTGAGGSIGSELCRQMARFEPRALIGLDQAETALYEIDREMRERSPHLVFRAEIADIRNRRRLKQIFATHRPQVIFHAAAYKHVPLMEAHLFEALSNNVFGTERLARIAAAHRAETFVLVSSDKAVRPVNVMGASKRLAEIVCALYGQTGPTRFLTVRFGNVLGSNGSVIPLFRRQLATGGPLTVTHPEMRRYFMTISEAAQLVLQASAMGQGGEIFVLEMGEQVRILDLARKMILLSGLRPDIDIPIEFCGIRVGEKLSEELYSPEEATRETAHCQIRVFRTPLPDPTRLRVLLDELRHSVRDGDAARAILGLKQTVEGYAPSIHILKQITKIQERRLVIGQDRLGELPPQITEPGAVRYRRQSTRSAATAKS